MFLFFLFILGLFCAWMLLAIRIVLELTLWLTALVISGLQLAWEYLRQRRFKW